MDSKVCICIRYISFRKIYKSFKYQKIIDISTAEKKEKKIKELEKRIRKKANKKLFGTTGAKIPISRARDELYYELKSIWYGKTV